jgi:tetratricopeptide (TPR) repeat protein
MGQAAVYTRAGKYQEAGEICKGLLVAHGDRAELHLLWGRIQAHLGRTRDAVESWQKAMKFSQDEALKLQAKKAIDAALQWEEVAGS